MNWSYATILLALLFTVVTSQRGGRRYVADQPPEESLTVENQKFQSRGKELVGDARRGEGRRARIQQTTEANVRSFTSRSRVNTEGPRVFHSRSGQEQEKKTNENRVFSSRWTQETDNRKTVSRDDSRTGRLRSQGTLATTDSGPRNLNSPRGRTRADNREVDNITRSPQKNRFSSRKEISRLNQDLVKPNLGENRRSDNLRSNIIRQNNVIEPPRSIETVTENVQPKSISVDEFLYTRSNEETGKDITITNSNTPIIEAKIQDFKSSSNTIESERTSPVNHLVTEKPYSRQLTRNGSVKRIADSSGEKNDQTLTRGRKKSQELLTRGSRIESQRQARPTSATITERSYSRQLTRSDTLSNRGRHHLTTEKISSSYEKPLAVNRRKGVEFEKKRPSEIVSSERPLHRKPQRGSIKSRAEVPTTENTKSYSLNAESKRDKELPNKEVNSVEPENKEPTEDAIISLTSEPKANPDPSDPNSITKQPDLLSTENTVDFPIKTNDVEEPNRKSRKLESDVLERNSFQKSENREFENSRRGRLETSLSKDRSRTQDHSLRDIEGRRSSRRFTTQSSGTSKENLNDVNDRGKTFRQASRTRTTEAANIRGRQNLDKRFRNNVSSTPKLKSNERNPAIDLISESVTQRKTEEKISTENQIQSDKKVEGTLTTEAAITSTEKILFRSATRKAGNRGVDHHKGKVGSEEQGHSGEVRDDDNYPEVYKQLKKSGTDSKDILAMLKARKAVREKLQKTSSNFPQPDISPKPSPQPAFGPDENKSLQEAASPRSKFRSRNQKSESLDQRSESKLNIKEKINDLVGSSDRNGRQPYFRNNRFKQITQNDNIRPTIPPTREINKKEIVGPKQELSEDRKYSPYKEIRSFNRKKNQDLPSPRLKDTPVKNSDVPTKQEKDGKSTLTINSPGIKDRNSYQIDNKSKKDDRHKSVIQKNVNEELKKEVDTQENNEKDTLNDASFVTERKLGFSNSGRNRYKNNNIPDYNLKEEEYNVENDKSLNTETSGKERKFQVSGGNKYRNEFNENRRPLNKGSRVNKFKQNLNKEFTTEVSFLESQTETAKAKYKYVPRNREKEYEAFKGRTEKTLESATIEPSVKPNYNLYNRNEHSSFRRRSYSTPTAEGAERIVMTTTRTRSAYKPKKMNFFKTTPPIPISRYRARKASLSKLFNEDNLKGEDDEDLRPRIDNLSIDSLISESEQSSFTTEGSTVSSRKRPRYSESHIQRVPPKRKGSESYRSSRSTTTRKPEVFTVLAIPIDDDSNPVNSIPETTFKPKDLFLEPFHESTTTLTDIISSTAAITTELTSTILSSTETLSTTSPMTTTTITEIPSSSTANLIPTEESTIGTTTYEASTNKATTDTSTLRTTSEAITLSTTTEEISTTTLPTTTTTAPTTTTTLPTTSTTTKRPTTATITTKRTIPTTSKERPTTAKTTTKRPTTAKTTTKNTTTTKKAPITTKKTTTAAPLATPTTTKTPKTTTTKRPIKTTAKHPTTKSTKTTTVRVASTTPSRKSTLAVTAKTTVQTSTSTPLDTSTISTTKVTQLTPVFSIDELISTKHPNFLSTIAYLAKNLTVSPTPYENVNTANFRASSSFTESTTPMQQKMAKDYVVYGLLPNNNVVRKVVKTTEAPVDVPFYIYGLYPNGTIVRRFPNGTVVPEETDDENEVIGKVEPGSHESLETVVKKDNPLSYLYPPGFDKTTKTISIPSTTSEKTSTTREKSNDGSTTDKLPIDPRIAPPSTDSNIEKPITTTKNKDPQSITTKPTIKPTTIKTTKATTRKPITKPTTKKVNTNRTTTKAVSSTTKSTTMTPTTRKPLPNTTTGKPQTKITVKPKTTPKTVQLTTKTTTTAKPSTKASTMIPSTKGSTSKPTVKASTSKLSTKASTSKPSTKTSTTKPTVTKPSTKASTTKPTTKASTIKPSTKITTTKPTVKPKATTTKPQTKVQTTSTTKNSIKTTPLVTQKQDKKTTIKPPALISQKASGEKASLPLSDAELLNNLLNQEGKEKVPVGTTDSTVQLADKVIQLAIERAQKSTTVPNIWQDISSTEESNLQLLSSTPNPSKKQLPGTKPIGTKNKIIDDANNNKTGKISVWVIPPEESTTTNSLNSNAVSKSDLDLLNALLSTPSSIESLPLSDQLLLANVLSSTAPPQTTKKKKKKSRTTTTTTPPPPAFPILQYLFGRNRGGGGGLFQRGLFRGGGVRGLEPENTQPQYDGGIFQNDGLPQGQGQGELAAESQNDPQQGEGRLVNAAINVSRAVSQFMGFVIQGAAQSFQNYLNTRTRALATALTYPPAS